MPRFTIEEQNSEKGTRTTHHLYSATLDDSVNKVFIRVERDV